MLNADALTFILSVRQVNLENQALGFLDKILTGLDRNAVPGIMS